MRFLAICVMSLAVACGSGSSSTKKDTTEPNNTAVDPAVKQAATCKALCATMGRCANDDDWDNSACAAACAKKPLAVKHLVAYDSCAATTECSGLRPCIGKVKLSIRQDKTCNKVCDRNNECVAESAKKNMSAAKAAEHTKDKIMRKNRSECMFECMSSPKTPGQIKGSDVCLAKTSCDEYTKCATGGSDSDDD